MKYQGKATLGLLVSLSLIGCGQPGNTVGFATAKDYDDLASSIQANSESRILTLDKANAKDIEEHCTDKDKDGEKHVVICHVPPGNPGAKHTIVIGMSAVRAHMNHGSHGKNHNERDYLGECQSGEPTPEPTATPTPEPTIVPTPEPTIVPNPEPTIVPTPEPTPEPTIIPNPEPTIVPVPDPTPSPTPVVPGSVMDQ
jgi:hypothetical protein